jgi:hypothetical protein
MTTQHIPQARPAPSLSRRRRLGRKYLPVAIAGIVIFSGLAALHIHRAVSYSEGRQTHANIMTTVFWVGEAADGDNAYISNAQSAWDEQWQAHYGGYDNPDHRSGANPAAFIPHENPFYFALPYNDYTDNGTHKPTASGCLPYTHNTNDKYSWCKNNWIAVTYHGKTAYGQWEDVGPNDENDSAYVFGTKQPRNTFGAHAGLDVSPAIRDYLGLDGENRTSWRFVRAADVPAGPWKAIVTTSLGDSLY